MIQIDAKSIENMLVTSVIVFDNDIERLTKNLKKREIKETLLHSIQSRSQTKIYILVERHLLTQ